VLLFLFLYAAAPVFLLPTVIHKTYTSQFATSRHTREVRTLHNQLIFIEEEKNLTEEHSETAKLLRLTPSNNKLCDHYVNEGSSGEYEEANMILNQCWVSPKWMLPTALLNHIFMHKALPSMMNRTFWTWNWQYHL